MEGKYIGKCLDNFFAFYVRCGHGYAHWIPQTVLWIYIAQKCVCGKVYYRIAIEKYVILQINGKFLWTCLLITRELFPADVNSGTLL